MEEKHPSYKTFSVQGNMAEISQSMRRLCHIPVKEGYIQETEEQKVEQTGSEVIERGLFQYCIKSLRKFEGVAYTSTHPTYLVSHSTLQYRRVIFR